MSVLAAAANATLPRLSNVVTRLEVRKLLRRKPDPVDGRFTQAVLTKAGRALVVRSAPAHVETVREFVIDALTPTQLRQLRLAADRIIARLDPDGMPFPPIE
jgi:DNA-binding MarR family transcriptional regulator